MNLVASMNLPPDMKAKTLDIDAATAKMKQAIPAKPKKPKPKIEDSKCTHRKDGEDMIGRPVTNKAGTFTT